MSLKGIYKPDVVTVTKDHLVIEAAKLMRDEHIGNVIVVDETTGRKTPIGFLTDRDIVIGCVAASDPTRIADVSVEEVMTRNPICAVEDEGVYSVLQKMRNEGVARLPVIDAQGSLVGIVTSGHLLQLLNDELTEIVMISESHKEAATDFGPMGTGSLATSKIAADVGLEGQQIQ